MYLTVGNTKFRFIRTYNAKGQKVNTVCQVKPVNTNIGWANAGIALLNPKDAKDFNKAVGKVVALADALENLNQPIEFCAAAMTELVDTLPVALPNWKWLNELIMECY